MKSPWARASICRRGMAGLKFQSKVLKRQSFAEAGVLDEAFDAALAAQAGLIGEQAMQELQVRPAGVLAPASRRRRVARRSRGCAGWRSRRGSGHAGSGGFVGFVWRFFFGRRFIGGSSGESKC